MSSDQAKPEVRRSNFRRFFLRGLAILLPTVLTIWILALAYNFVDQKIAAPINRGVQALVVRLSPIPGLTQEDVEEYAR